jgi:hypothetical protein
VNAAPEAHARSMPRVDPLVAGAVAGLGLLIFAWVVFANGDITLTLLPFGLAAVVLAAAVVPLRYSMLALGFLALTLENPTEIPADGKWRSPLYTVGALMLAHINLTIPIKALIFSGLDLALVLLVSIYVVRRLAGLRTDVRGQVPAAAPLRAAGVLCIVTIAVLWAFGMARAAPDFGNSLWQIFRLVYLPSVFLVFCAALRGPADARALGTAFLLAALLRACMAIYVRHLYPDTEAVAFATVHADSMLFAGAFLLVLAILFERPRMRSLLLALCTLPILGWGMIANNRRLVWVELGTGILVLYLLTPFTRLKRRMAQVATISIPLVLVYVAAGWGSHSPVFAPVHTLRSVVDAQADQSTLWRDLENYNIYVTFKANPVLGTGLGHGYTEAIKLPSISGAYALYRFAPHNSILGLFAYAGGVGFLGLWLIIPLGIFFAIRSYRAATLPADRISALAIVGVLLVYELHCYGDMGLGTWTSVFLVAPALALAGKLAVATGAWPARTPRSA